MQPQRYQRSRLKGARLLAGVVCVTRPGKWGNPYVVGRDGNAEACVARFIARYEHDAAYQARVRQELRGKHLACWCPLDAAHCHADVLLQWANQPY